MEKTIAAISSGLQPSGICIVRMSGPEALTIADAVFRSKNGKKRLSKAKSHTIHYGFISDGTETLDEVLVSVMRAPHTYTGEDTVEINCHGGVLVAKRVLELLIGNGASAAEPGEFTKRAFLNGRMDLSRAEAVIGVINAQNDFALKASVRQLKGAVSVKIRAFREAILDEMSFIEAALDDPEHYNLDGFGEILTEKLSPVLEEVHELIKRADYGSILAEGVRTVIAGRPNAGKSSLLNVLAGFERAIVTEIAGTTRDVLTEQIRLRGISLILMDTAGIRETEDKVEKIGVDRAKEALRDADLVLYVVDAVEGITAEDLEVLSSCENQEVIVLMNKTDLLDQGENAQEEAPLPAFDNPRIHTLSFSAKTQEGLSALEKMIESLYDAEKLLYNDEVMITSARQKALLTEAETSLSLALSGAAEGLSEDFLNVDLMNAYRALGEIIGEEVTDDVIDRVFEKFCMGK
ncbi:MAG: tRNA uridine-5-carboxymethylaminomethyl(34) synthesis GTPase MnmE [Lachnospiraceae bacterium]|nr:tRNA uridine-5-carboxymethylaminomethyl(34) synthesis GTPase MnmE [Lachnospiraceae bacterium]